MTSTPTTAEDPTVAGFPVPRTVVCGVDGSRGSAEAIRQTVALAGHESRIEFVLVESFSGHGPTAMAAVAPVRGAAALSDAVRCAAEARVPAESRVVESTDAAGALVALASHADLLVVGSSPHSRAGGIVLGRVATAAAHRAPCDVLVARHAPGERAFPQDILLAFDGSAPSRRAARIAGALARRHDSRVAIASFGRAPAERRASLAQTVVELTETTGREPVVVSGDGHAHERIAETAAATGASLIVMGARGLSGVRALGSVSERVAHAAPCSVLIARAAAER